jgi:hypothetical protein
MFPECVAEDTLMEPFLESLMSEWHPIEGNLSPWKLMGVSMLVILILLLFLIISRPVTSPQTLAVKAIRPHSLSYTLSHLPNYEHQIRKNAVMQAFIRGWPPKSRQLLIKACITAFFLIWCS